MNPSSHCPIFQTNFPPFYVISFLFDPIDQTLLHWPERERKGEGAQVDEPGRGHSRPKEVTFWTRRESAEAEEEEKSEMVPTLEGGGSKDQIG